MKRNIELLSPNEFIVGSIKDAKPLSLFLSENENSKILIGYVGEVEMAVFICGEYQGKCFECSNNLSWQGVIIPNVRIEIDETSWVSHQENNTSIMAVIRIGDKLVVKAQKDDPYGRFCQVELHHNLPSCSDYTARFMKWQVALGDGQDKRVLWSSMK